MDHAIKVNKRSGSESITSGGYKPAPDRESITSEPIVCYKRRDGSVQGESPDKKIVVHVSIAAAMPMMLPQPAAEDILEREPRRPFNQTKI